MRMKRLTLVPYATVVADILAFRRAEGLRFGQALIILEYLLQTAILGRLRKANLSKTFLGLKTVAKKVDTLEVPTTNLEFR